MDNLSQRLKNVDWNNLKRHALKVRGEAASKLKDFCMTDIENKVRAATSNKSWGASTSDLFEIAQSTFNNEEYPLIMAIVWQRLNDHGRNWRHVYKALELLRYLLMHGSSRVMDEVQDALYHIRSLQDFRYVDSVTHKDEGANVRIKAKQVVDLVSDERVLQEERQKSKELYLKVASSGGANRFGGISSNDLYTGYNRDYISGSDVAVGGRYSNTYEYFEAANEPVASRDDYEVRVSVSEEERNTRREQFTTYHELSDTEHVQSRSSTLPGAVRLGPGSSTSSATQGHAANFGSSVTRTKEMHSGVSDLISWDDNELPSETSKEQAFDSYEMIDWDSEFDPRRHETHSSSTEKKKSPLDLLLADASGNSTNKLSETSSFAASQGRVDGSAKNVKSKGRERGFTGFETTPNVLQNDNIRVEKNERLVSSESPEQGSSTMKAPSNKKPVYGNENMISSRSSDASSDPKSTASAAQASMDPFGSLVNDLMSTKLGQSKYLKDSAKVPNQNKDE
ncbi:hypothetical protein GpartN1_g1644.t1 [Galdieria partita]|uniref:ENTH domain-containing protein n=1 Tax=Galdieria partita TaxID=83374 RepID=A0A9C7PSG4_9RHOD|nr:hypothetical protein GpartN1_g1644.t1 [Galdieria partita]